MSSRSFPSSLSSIQVSLRSFFFFAAAEDRYCASYKHRNYRLYIPRSLSCTLPCSAKTFARFRLSQSSSISRVVSRDVSTALLINITLTRLFEARDSFLRTLLRIATGSDCHRTVDPPLTRGRSTPMKRNAYFVVINVSDRGVWIHGVQSFHG